MAHHSFNYKGYEIWLAAIQASKRARGGHTRTLQVRLKSGNCYQIKKSVRYDINDVDGFGNASKKATDWIDEQEKELKRNHAQS